ncbi:hypothetical protein V1509DRAFT_451753 [Lipomyces kononenkoae]
MVQQLAKAIDVFEKSHPDCTALFCFDQSSNHQALPPNATVVRKHTLNDKKAKGLSSQDTWSERGKVKTYATPKYKLCLHGRKACAPSSQSINSAMIASLCQRKAPEINLSERTQCCATHFLS